MNTYLNLVLSDIFRKFNKPSKPIKHRQTCPNCKRQNVNLYIKNKEWKCKKCWEEADHGEKD